MLAAGRGRRFGSDKRIARLRNGQGLLATSIAQAQRHFAKVYVLLRGDDDPQQLGLSSDTAIVRCPDADKGMGTSLAAAVTAVSRLHPQAQAIAVLLGDMPWIADGTLQRLIHAADASRIVFPVYNAERGHPVIFGKQYWPQLQGLVGDQGAKALLQEHALSCVSVVVEDAAILLDVDRPDALR